MRSTTINIDTGGTFTDAFVVRNGGYHTVKTLTTPHDLAVCFRDVIAKAAGTVGLSVPELLRETATVRYSTTVGTNTVIERTGPRLGLIAGPGGDDLYAGNGQADAAFGLFLDRGMVSTLAAGARADTAVHAAKELLARSARGLVCALPAADDGLDTEVAVREQFEHHYPKHCLDAVPLLLSREMAADPDDFRRTATALFNAYVHPTVADFLYRAEDHLRENGYRRPLLVVHNDGGAARVAKTIAGRTYNSGPLAGLMGATVIAQLYGIDQLVTVDMGGTSLDAAVVAGGEVPVREHGVVEDVELAFPLPDLLTLGAGGGSIAQRVDGAIRVGPRSAGAKPGPACFGLGGSEPTVTDADVVLGFVHPERFLDGAMTLRRDLAEQAIATLADPGADVVGLAAEVRQRVDQDMGERIAAELRRQHLDPAATVMLAFGGNGPVHACGIAEAAGIREIVTVPFASVFSAFGASSADIRHAYTGPPGGEVVEELRRRALRDMRGEGFSADAVTVEVNGVEKDGEAFVEVVAEATLPHYEFPAARRDNGFPGSERRQTREVVWPGRGPATTPVYDASLMTAGSAVNGPALIEASDTTHVIPAGWTYSVDGYGNGRLRARQRGEEAGR